MRIHTKIALLTATMALGAAPALALGPPSGTPVPTNTGTAHMPTTPGSQGSQGTANAPSNPGSQGTAHKPSTPGPNATLPAKAKAYGQYCQSESKTHVAGTPGTPFSKCVTDMAKLANGSSKNPRTACKDESKQHVDGHPGTPFSLCVSGGAKLLKNQAAGSANSNNQTTSTPSS
jgi:hypothetical protein